MEIELTKLMVLERILLEYESRHKFDLEFDDAFKLYDHLSRVGRITSYAFLIQDEFANACQDNDKLKEYHARIMNGKVDFDATDVIEFIDKLSKIIDDEHIREVVNDNRFWL